jgi:hypothetical protein
MDKKLITEINRNRELMNLGNVVIKEAVGLNPLQLLEKFLGKSFSTIMTKLTGSEAEQFALKFIGEMEEVIEKKAGGRTIEQLAEDAGSNLSRKVLREVLERAEYTALRETISEGIVSANYAKIKNIFLKYPKAGEDQMVKGQMVKELTRTLGIPPGISKEFFGEWNKMVAAEEAAMGKFGTKAGEQGAEQGVVKAGEQGAEDLAKKAEQDALKKAEQEAVKKAEEEATKIADEELEKSFNRAIELLRNDKQYKRLFTEEFEDFTNQSLIYAKQNMKQTLKEAGNDPLKAMELMKIRLDDVAKEFPEVKKATESFAQLYKKSWRPVVKEKHKFDGSVDREMKMLKTSIKYTGNVTAHVAAIYLLNGVAGFFILFNRFRKDPNFTINQAIAKAFVSGCWNLTVGSLEAVLGDQKGHLVPPPTPAPAPPVAGAKYANNIDGFKQFCKDETIDGANAISLSGGVYKTNTTSAVEYKFKELDATTKLGTFE